MRGIAFHLDESLKRTFNSYHKLALSADLRDIICESESLLRTDKSDLKIIAMKLLTLFSNRVLLVLISFIGLSTPILSRLQGNYLRL